MRQYHEALLFGKFTWLVSLVETLVRFVYTIAWRCTTTEACPSLTPDGDNAPLLRVRDLSSTYTIPCDHQASSSHWQIIRSRISSNLNLVVLITKLKLLCRCRYRMIPYFKTFDDVMVVIWSQSYQALTTRQMQNAHYQEVCLNENLFLLRKMQDRLIIIKKCFELLL